MKLRSGIDSSQPAQIPVKATNKTKTSSPLQKEAKIEGKATQSKTEAATKESVGDVSVTTVSTGITKVDKKIRKKQRGKKRKNKAFLASLAANSSDADDQSIPNYPSLPGTWPKTPPQSHTRSGGNEVLASGSQTTCADSSLPGKWPKTPPQHSSLRGYSKTWHGGLNAARLNNKHQNDSRNDRTLPNNAQAFIPRNSFHKGFFKPKFSRNDSVITEELDDIKTIFETIEDELIAVALIMDNISSSGVAQKEGLSNMIWRMYFAYNAAQSINDKYLHPRRS